jgi:hypothetical protein
MSILGLTSGKTFADQGFYSLNDRRQIFHQYPNGAAPLTGLLSLMDDEATDSPDFGWFEKRFVQIRTTVLSATASISPVGSDTASASPTSINVGTVYRIKVTSAAEFKAGQTIWIKDAPVTGGIDQIYGIITAIISSTSFEFRPTTNVNAIINTNVDASGLAGNDVFSLGTSASEGAVSGTGRLTVPINPRNFTQIHRNAIYFTATSLKIPTKFDKSGIYREKAKDAAIDHMTGIEKSFLFGTRSLQNVAHPITGELVPQRTSGGLFYFLNEYEKAAGGVFGYRPGGLALTSNSDEDKRVINVAGAGALPYADFSDYIERVFRRTNNKAFEKLVLCGSGVLQALNKLVELNLVTINKGMTSESTYGMSVTSIETVFGTLHFKSHPLFTEDPTLRYSALITDVGELRYRALNDRDTTLLPNRQQNDEDGRKDEWLTEAGLECRFPESHMLIHNLRSFTV